MKLQTTILALLLVLAPLGIAQAQGTQPMNMYDTLASMGNFKMFLAAVDKANVGELKQMAGPFTVFAPDDAAWGKLPKETVDKIMADPAIVRNVVYYAITPGKYLAKDLPGLKECKTLCPTAGSELLHFTKMGDHYMVNNAQIVKPDVLASNGVIHEVDAVLMPKMAPPKVP